MKQAKRVVASCAMSMAMMISVSASAQDKPAPVELSPTQIETNNRAVRMLGETPPRTKEAIKLVEAALLMEKQGDLLYLTLGRAYQLDGQCARAAEQFDAAERAPGVQGVPEDFVPGQLGVYRKELESCMGSLIISCEPDDLELVMNDEPVACETPVDIEPGSYKIKVRNPSSGDTLELPVQIAGGETTRPEIKLGTKEADPDPAPVPDPGSEEEPSSLNWRVAPYFGMGLGVNVIESVDATGVDPELEFVGDSSFLFGVGAEGRVLTGTPALRYGVGWDARFEFGPGSDRGGYEFNDVTVAWGAKIGLNGQVWWSERVGVYAGAVLRPRSFRVKLCNDEGTACSSTDARGQKPYFLLFAPTLGGGLKLELGDLLGFEGLELTAGWMQSLTGQAASVASDDRFVPGLDLSLRAQIKRLTIGFGFEAWHAQGDALGVFDDQRAYNLRTQQGVLTFGWTFGG